MMYRRVIAIVLSCVAAIFVFLAAGRVVFAQSQAQSALDALLVEIEDGATLVFRNFPETELARLHVVGTLLTDVGKEAIGVIPLDAEQSSFALPSPAAGELKAVALDLIFFDAERYVEVAIVDGGAPSQGRSVSTEVAPTFATAATTHTAFDRYVVRTSRDADGPTFQWQDISLTGTPVNGSFDDSYSGPYDIGFHFPFFEGLYDSFYLSSNGFIGFGPPESYGSLNNTIMPQSNTPNNIIAWLWDDLYLSSNTVHLQTLSDTFVIQFTDHPFYGSGETVTAQVILEQNGNFTIQYYSLSDEADVDGATIGAENADGTKGVQVAYNEPFVEAGLAVHFERKVVDARITPAQSRRTTTAGLATTHTLTLANYAGLPISYSLQAESGWNLTMPQQTPVIADGGSYQFDAIVEPPANATEAAVESRVIFAEAFSGTQRFTATTTLETCTPCADLSVEQRFYDGEPIVGDEVRYAITLQNSGTETMTNVVLTYILPDYIAASRTDTNDNYRIDKDGDGYRETYLSPSSYRDNILTWEIDQLAPNGSGEIWVEYRLPLSVDVGEEFTNLVTISADQAEINSDNNRAAVTMTAEEGQPNLVISKYGRETATSGDDLQYSISWHNDDGFARDIVITDVLPIELTAVRENHSASFPGDPGRPITVYNDGRVITWVIGTAGPDSSGSMSVIGRIPNDFTGTLTNTAQVSASNELNISDNWAAVATNILPPTPDMYISKSWNSGRVAAENDIQYQIYWRNQGTDAAPNVVITDTLPPELSIIEVTGYSRTPNHQNVSPTTINGNELRWELGDVPIDGYGYLYVTARISADVTPGDTLFNEAFVSISPNEVNVDNNRESDSRTIQTPYTDLEIYKHVSNRFNRGNQVIYNLNWYNDGTAIVDNVVITDTFPSDLVFEGFHATGSLTTTQLTHTQDGDTHIWTLGTLRPFWSGNIYIAATVPLTIEPTTIVTNTVTISADPIETNTDNNVAVRVNEILAETADMSISTGLGTTPVIGSELLYYLDYQNYTRYVSAYDVVITNTLPADVTFRRAEWWPHGDGSRAVPITPTIDGQTLSFDLGVVRDRYWYGYYGATPDYFGRIYIHAYLPESATSGTDLVNRAGIVATNEGENTSNNSAEHATTVSSNSPSRDLQVDVYRNSGSSIAGQEDIYTFYVSNRGYAHISDIVVTGTLPISATFVSATDRFGNDYPLETITTDTTGRQVLSWNIGTLLGQGNGYFYAHYINVTARLDAALSDDTPLVLDISAFGAEDEIPNNYANYDTYNLTSQSPTVDLAVTVTFDESQAVAPGRTVLFDNTIRNYGNMPTDNAVMTVTLPTGFALSSVSSLGTFEYVVNGEEIVFSADSLTAGFYDHFYIYAIVGDDIVADQPYTYNIEIGSDSADVNPDNNTATATATGDEIIRSFTFRKEDITDGEDGYEYLPNSQVDWRIYYYNTGNQPEELTAIDLLPDGMTLINVEDSNDNWSRTTTPDGAVWTTLEPIQPGHSGYLYIRAHIDSDVPAATALTNEVRLETATSHIVTATSTITVAGPRLDLASTSVDLGTSYVNYPTEKRIWFRNAESGELVISGITSADPQLTVSPTTLTLAPNATGYITLTLSPDTVGDFASTLTVASNSYLSASLPIAVTSETLQPPTIEVRPTELLTVLNEDERVTQTLTISNTGQSDLSFIFAGQPTLQQSLERFNQNHANITAAIPNFYQFYGGTGSNYISDGGRDMFDGGNYLYLTDGHNSRVNLSYSDNQITTQETTSYYTSKVPGLFLMAADLDGFDKFETGGWLGADDRGYVDASIVETTVYGTSYMGFVKRVYGEDASVNHLIVVPSSANAAHEYSTSTNSDYHQVYDLPDQTRIYYLLFSGYDSDYYNDTVMLEVMERLLLAVGDTSHTADWLTIPTNTCADDLFFSEYVEGSSSNRALEIYNGTGHPIDLANYTIERYANGSDTPTVFLLSGTLPDGQTFVITHPSASSSLTNRADITDSNFSFDGDDALVLRHVDGTALDRIGQVGVDPGSEWGSGDISTQDNTLRRLTTVVRGNVNTTDAFDPALEWIGFSRNTFDGIGYHEIAGCVAGRTEGVIVAGSALALPVAFDSTGLISGTYALTLPIASNDPVQPFVTVPVTLYVGGDSEPRLEPTSVDLGAVFVGGTATTTVTLHNDGIAGLNVTQVASSDPAVSIAPENATVAALGSRTLTVQVAPQSVRSIAAVLTLTTSSVLSPMVTLSVSAESVLPPVITIDPTTVAETVIAGNSETVSVTIENSGGSALDWATIVLYRDSSDEATARQVVLRSGEQTNSRAANNPILVAVAGANSADATNTFNNDPLLGGLYIFQDVGNNYTLNTLLPYNLVLIDETDNGISSAEADALNAFHQLGRGIVIGMDDFDSLSNAVRNQLFPIFGISAADDGDFAFGAFGDHAITAGLTTMSNVGSDNDHFVPSGAEWLVRGNDGNYYGLAYSGNGRSVIFGESLQAWYNASNELVRASIAWADLAWLSVTPETGNVAQSTSDVFALELDATNLISGTYLADVVLASNDPIAPQITLPVTLTVIGQAVLEVEPTVLEFGSAFTNFTNTQALTIRNTGSDTLIVSDISSDSADVTVDVTSFELAPYHNRVIEVGLHPSQEGAISAELTILSNATAPTTAVPINATGVPAPEIVVAPQRFNIRQDTGVVMSYTLDLRNDGVGTLNYDLALANNIVTITPTQGILSSGGQQQITVIFDTTQRSDGFYSDVIEVTSNDPDEAFIQIPVNMSVVLVPPEEPVNPDPLDNEININIYDPLRWQRSPHASSYDVYLWQDGESKPASPSVTLNNYNYYNTISWNPPGDFATNTTYHWQVIARNGVGTATGAEWTFTTETLPDLSVTTVTVPPTSFSGQTIEISWVVANNGQRGTNQPQWYDLVYVSPAPTYDSQTATYLGRAVNASYLNAGESYQTTETFNLPQGLDGNYYLHVISDGYNAMREVSDDNNVGNSSATNVSLTPPPDLQVTAVTGPFDAFSGESINFSWTVENSGGGSTISDSWYDDVYLSEDQLFDDTDTYLGRWRHSGALGAGESYSRSESTNLPQEISGNYYLFVRTDIYNDVYEHTSANNNTSAASGAINVRLTPPPDLVVSSVTFTPTNPASGLPLTVQWTVENEGAGSPYETYWRDRVYLSTSDTLDLGTAQVVATRSRYGTLEPGTTYDRDVTFNLPNGTEGTYYLFVTTDYDDSVFELDADNNNTTGSSGFAVALSPTPDLRITNVVMNGPTATIGTAYSVSWTTGNFGSAATNGNWQDTVYLSVSNTWTGSGIAISSYNRPSNLTVSDVYTDSHNLIIPSSLSAGVYYLYVVADSGDTVYEFGAENNNASSGHALELFRPSDDDSGGNNPGNRPVNLEIGSATAITEALSGEAITVTWQVTNTSQYGTVATSWVDRVYLSADAALDNGDAMLGGTIHHGSLASGSTYSVTTQLPLPNGIAGEYTLFVLADADQNVNDNNRNDNLVQISQPISVTLAPAPDLTIAAFTVPANGLVGQPVEVSWTVTNDGAVDAGGSWYDGIYFSYDATIDASDRRLATVQHTGGLAVGTSYQQTQTVTIPNFAAGNYYLIVATDSRNDVYEFTSEGNNRQAETIAITVPAPGDLVVRDVTLPASGTPGETISVNWQVENIGANRVSGYMCETVFISADATWDIGDISIAEQCRSIDLNTGQSGRRQTIEAVIPEAPELATLTGNLPGVTAGSYYAIVRTDIRNQIPESDETNNSGASVDLIDVGVTELILNETVTDTLNTNVSLYYRLSITETTPVLITLDGLNDAAANELYVSFGTMPTRSSFEFSFAEAFSADQEIIIPLANVGEYYIYVYGATMANASDFTLRAEAIDFSLRSAEPSVVGNAGESTVHIRGARFNRDTVMTLISADGIETSVSATFYEDAGSLYATFDFTDHPVGQYTLRATNSAESVTLGNAITVEEGAGALVEVDIVGPSQVRPDRDYILFINYTNNGDADAAAPLLLLKNPNGHELGLSPNRLATSDLQVLGINGEGPAGILPPGARHSVPVYLHTTNDPLDMGVYAIKADYAEMVDWQAFEDQVRPTGLPDETWTPGWANIQARIGSTWGEFVASMAEVSTYLGQRGERTGNIEALFDELFRQEFGLSTSIISGRLINAETQTFVSNKKVTAHSTTLTETIRTAYTNSQGEFEIDLLAADSYFLTVEDYYFESREIYTVSTGIDVLDLQLTVLPIPEDEPFEPYPVVVSDRDITLTIDDDGVTHMVWQRDNQLWHGSLATDEWNNIVPIEGAIGRNPEVIHTPTLGGGSTNGLLLSWETKGVTSTIQYAAAIGNEAGDYAWGMPTTVTSDDNSDSQPTIAVGNNGTEIVWLQRGDLSGDDFDLYFADIDPLVTLRYVLVRPGTSEDDPGTVAYITAEDIPLDAVDALLSQSEDLMSRIPSGEFCARVEIDEGINIPIPLLKGKYGFEAEFEACASLSCDLEASGSGTLGVGFGKHFTGSGTISAAAKWEANPETCEYDFVEGEVELSARVSRDFAPDVSFIEQVPFVDEAELDLALFVQLGGGMGWHDNFPSWPDSGFVNMQIGGEALGELEIEVFFFEFEVKIEGEVYGTLTYNIPGGWDPDLCAELSGYYDHGDVEFGYSGEWCLSEYLRRTMTQPFDDLMPSHNTIVLRTDNATRSQATDLAVDGSVVVATFNPKNGTGNVYEGTPVLSDTITTDLGNDGAPASATSSDGEVMVTWTKESDDYNISLGSAVVVSTQTVDGWGETTTVQSNDHFNRDTAIVYDGNDNPIIAWSSASTAGITAASAITDVLQAMASSDIYYSVRESGVWSEPAPIAILDGRDDETRLAAYGSSIAAAWLNDLNNDNSIQVAAWNGNSWSQLPAIAAEEKINSFDVSHTDGNILVTWAETEYESSVEDLRSSIYYVIWNGNSWSDEMTLVKPELTPREQNSSPAASTAQAIRGLLPDPPEDCCECQEGDENCCEEGDEDCEDDDDDDDDDNDGDNDDDPNEPPPPPSPPGGPDDPYNPPNRQAVDPNDILGPDGYGDARWVGTDEALGYTIRFENDPVFATAPAQTVIITQTLDSDLDARRFRLGAFGFGDYLFSVPDNRSFYSQRLDLRDELNLYVDVTAGIDLAKREAFWILRSIDPATGAPPNDALAGFLPPNLEAGEGEGFVSYTVLPNADAATGSIIDAEARIIFDTNDPIDTPPIFNTIDGDDPESNVSTPQVRAADVTTDDPELIITWQSGDGAGSGLQSVDLYVAEGEGAFVLAQSGITETATIFTGEIGRLYGFYTRAHDNAGNTEDEKQSAEATYLILGEPIEGLSVSEPQSAELGNSVTLTASVTTGSNIAYRWSLGDGTTDSGAEITHDYAAIGTYTVVVTANNLTNVLTATTTVEITDVPLAGLNVESDSPTELGSDTAFTATLTTGSNAAYTWAFGDGTTANGDSVTHQYAAIGTYTATVTATNSVNTLVEQVTVEVRDVPIAGLSATAASPIAVGATTNLTATITDGTNVTYRWSFGDGATDSGATVTHAYVAVGTYTATVTATNGVNSQVATTVIEVVDVELAGLTATNDSPTQIGDTTALSATITTGTNVDYAWAFGDGNSGNGANVIHTYAAVGTYTATVTATNGVNNQMMQTVVEVIDVPISGLAAQSDSPTLLGAMTEFTATITGGSNISYAWDFGDGNSADGQFVTHIYEQPDSYTVTLRAENRRGIVIDTLVVNVFINPTAVNDSYTGPDATPLIVSSAAGVLANDFDRDGDSLRASVITLPQHGELLLESSGAFIYTPTLPYSGTDSFVYQALNSREPLTATVTLTIFAVDEDDNAVVIEPETETMLATSSKTVSVTILTNSVSATTTLVLNVTDAATQEPPTSALFTGRFFTLEAYRDGAYMDGFVFARPITVTLQYDDQAFAHMDESKLQLLYWDGFQWVDSATSCDPASIYLRDLEKNELTVAICHLTEFAVAAPQIPLAVSISSVKAIIPHSLWLLGFWLATVTVAAKFVDYRRRR